MGGRSTRTGGSKKLVGMEIVKVDHTSLVKEAEESTHLPPPPHLSGAYIRSLVKQLSSSKNKDIPILDIDDGVIDKHDGDGFDHDHQVLMIEEDESRQQSHLPQSQQQQQHKKQVRRRLHTTRPYQERLLNMAEARREIVTALKFHRASMKQSTDREHHHSPPPTPPPPPVQPQPPQPFLHPPPPPPQQSSSLRGRTKCRRNRRIYPSTTSCLDSNFSYYHPEELVCCSSSTFVSPNMPHCWPSNFHEIPPSPPPPPPQAITTGNLMNFGLGPNQRPLGLNLNIHDFTNFEANLYHHNNPTSSSSSTSPPSPVLDDSFQGHPIKLERNNNLEAMLKQQQQQQGNNSSEIADPNNNGNGSIGGDEELIMSEMEWMGEQHQMEWNDTMNLVTSAWWFKFFKAGEEIGQPKYKGGDDDGGPFDQVMVDEFPEWLNTANDQSCFHHCADADSYQDPALPCMDIGEIEGMDEEWLP